MTVRTETWALKGGLDLESPAMSIPAGRAIVAQNYEAAMSGGYRRMDGYELFDGSATPSVVSGSGDILGVWEYGGDVYAFRNNTLGTACVMHRSTATGWVVVPTGLFPVPSGKFEFVNHNFAGSSSTEKMYGVDGKNNCFEWNGTVFANISTGMTTDTPTHIGVHKNHLFLSFEGGSIQHSGVGAPASWTLNTGAGEIGIGTEITNIDSMRGNALVITGSDRINILYGTSSADWDLKSFSTELGVVANTTEIIDAGLVWFNGRNVTHMSTTQSFGDFNTASLSTRVTKLLSVRLDKVVGSSVNYKKNQYRLFFNDKTVAVATIVNNKLLGWTSWLIPHVPTAVSSGYMGCTDGSVMALDTGTSFNGATIDSFLRLVFNSFKTPHRQKRFRKLLLEMEVGSQATMQMVADYGYGVETSSISDPLTVAGSGGYWDTVDWADFNWSATIVSQMEAVLNGSGRNMSALIYHTSSSDPSFTVQGISVNYSIRGLIR